MPASIRTAGDVCGKGGLYCLSHFCVVSGAARFCLSELTVSCAEGANCPYNF